MRHLLLARRDHIRPKSNHSNLSRVELSACETCPQDWHDLWPALDFYEDPFPFGHRRQHLLQRWNLLARVPFIFPSPNVQDSQLGKCRLGNDPAYTGCAFRVFIMDTDNLTILCKVKVPFNDISSLLPCELECCECVFRRIQ